MLPVEAMSTMSAQTNVSPRDPSAQNVQAGYTSILAEGKPTGDAYYEVIAENEEIGYSPTTQSVNDVLYQEESQRMIDMIPEILLDPALDDDTKQEALETATSSTRPENTMAYQYARDLTEQPEAEADAEYATAKQAGLSVMKDIVDYNLALDAAIDQAGMHNNQTFTENATDFVQMMIPFWEATTVGELTSLVGGDAGDVSKAFILMGEGKDELRKAFKAIPLDQRAVAARFFVDAIMEANSNVFMTNELSSRGLIDAVLHGDYSDTDRWLDNLVSLSELTIIGKPVAWGASKIKRLADARKVTSQVRNSSPVRMAQESNASEARSLVSDMIHDETGEVAQAASGTSRTEAVMDNITPEPNVGGGGLRSKVGNVTGTYEKSLVSNPDVAQALEDSAIGALTKKEIEAANATVVNRLKNATGVTSRGEMFSVTATETGADIRGVYGPTEGGYTSAQEARDLAAIALRTEGVDPNDITILKRGTDGEYHPVEGIPTEDGDYLASFSYNYETRFSDIVGNWSELDVKRNFLDRSPLAAKAGVQRHLVDPASMLHKHIVFGANAAVDKAAFVTKSMLEDAKVFSDQLGALPNERQSAILKYIKEANEKGLKFNEEMIRAEWNFSDAEIKALKSFRSYWDDVWAIRNRVDAKAMADEGYVVLEDAASQTRIYGRPRSSAHLDKNKSIFLPETGGLESIDAVKADLDLGRGQVIQMRRPMEYDGVVTDYVFVRNSDNVRGVTKSDIVYPYRDGYYEVNYTSPHFIVQTVTDGTRTFRKAIATAETTQDAQLYLKRLQKAENLTDEELLAKYTVRGDIKDRQELAGFEQDMYESYGHGNQRARGNRLEDATAVVRNTEQNNIKGPVDTMIDTARLMGNRVAMTDYLNAAKQRFMETYADVLPKENGLTRFPARMEDIGDASNAASSRVADARTTFEYLAYLEHGYINSMSEVSKSMLRSVADALGARGFGKLETLARKAAEASITDTAKTAAFQLYIALNPLRQGLLNAHQSMLLLANFPKYALSPKGLTADFTAFADLAISGGKNLKALAKMSGRSESELRLMYKEFEKSGLPDSIDLHNMVRGTLTEFAEGTRFSHNAASRAVGSSLRGVRKVGFDSGEWVNLATAWLAHYDKASAGRKALSKTDLHEVAAKARNYTLNMSRAGDMPYNQNSFSLLAQFFQVPHKAMLQMTNRGLSRSERARLGLYNAFAYSLPAGAMYSIFGDILPDEQEYPELHQAVVQGLEFYGWNKMIEGFTGLDVDIDFSSLAPSDPYGVYEVLHAIFTTESGSLLAASPAGSLFFGNNPRLTNLAKTAARFFNVTEDFEGDPTTMAHVFRDIGHLSSGWSNFYKAKMALEYGKLYSTRGEVVDPKVSTPEAIALAFGFPTMDAAREYALNNKLYKTKEAARKDVDKWFNEYTTRLNREGITAEEIDYTVRTMQQSMRVFADNPFAMERINFKLQRAVERGDATIYNSVLRLAGELPPSEAASLMRLAPNYDPQAKRQLIDVITHINQHNNGE